MDPTEAAISTHRFDTPLHPDDILHDIEVNEGDIDILALKREAELSGAARARVTEKRYQLRGYIRGLQPEALIRSRAEQVLAILSMSRYRRGPIGFVEEFKETFIAEIIESIKANRPIELVLSFFGSKVLNPLKTFSTTGCEIDLSETASLLRFYELTQAIKELYPPGAVMNIACDGRKYSRPLGFPDEQGKNYFLRLQQLAKYLEIEASVNLFDEADLYPDDYEKIRISNVERVAHIVKTDPTHELAQTVQRMRPSIASALPLDPCIDMKTLVMAYSGLTEGTTQLERDALDVRREIATRAKEATIAYIGTYDAVKSLGILEGVRKQHHALRATVHPKPGQLGLYSVNESCAERFPHHGTGLFKGFRRQAGIDNVRVAFRADLVRLDSELLGIRLDPSRYPFIDPRSQAPFTIVSKTPNK